MLKAEIEPGTLINNRYQIQRVLGQGGFGRTYLAYDTERFGELCVLKEFLPSSKTEYVVQKSRELFEREARVLYQLDHPQIPKFLAWFTHEEGLFLVQQYIDGKTYTSLLRERQQRGQLFPEAEIVRWLNDLLSVLSYIHDRRIVHRDISPDNIMLPYGQSEPVLIDFGLVKQTVSQIWANKPQSVGGSMGQHSFVGKFGYAPPEQIRMGQCHPCGDLYALAVTALVLLTGREPNWLIDHESLEWQWRSYVNVSEHLAQVLDKMLAEKPKQRYQSAQEVLDILQRHPSFGTFSGTFGMMAVSQPLVELQIEIDEASKNRQVAEIEQTDYFQQLQEQVELLRNDFAAEPETQLQAEYPLLSALSEETTVSGFESAVDSATELEAPIRSKLDPAFLDLCEKELARCIGRMASYLLNEVLADNPGISAQQLVEALAEEIPNPQQAQAFRKIAETASEKPKPTTSPRLDPAFLDRCQKELARCIGPMASYLLNEVLAKNPGISAQQFVEELAEEIPNPQQAQAFRKIAETAPEIQPKSATSPRLDQAFLERCQQELARSIGPMASYLVEETLAKNPGISAQQFVEALAEEIPNAQKAQAFRKIVETASETQPKPAALPKPNPAFLKRCQQELARCIGPMASYILDETLAKHPEISLQQLVETLAAEIPNPQKAVEFRKHLLL